MKPADLSVVIPTHNRAHLIERAVWSARAAGAEVVVVDDGSHDNTPELMDQIADEAVLFRRIEVSQGPGMARNVGVKLASRGLVLFLDDDDYLLPGGGEAILRVAEEHPDVPLYLHNCMFEAGRPSIPRDTAPVRISYRDWLAGTWDAELKPVARRELFEAFAFEDTGAGGEGLLWGKVVREHGAIVSGEPVVLYTTSHPDRLTAPALQLRNASANAAIAAHWLDEFGTDLRVVNEGRWSGRLTVAVVWHLLAGQQSAARALIAAPASPRPPRALRVALTIATLLPETVLRALFLARGHVSRLRNARTSAR